MSRTWGGKHRCCREAAHSGACEVDPLELDDGFSNQPGGDCEAGDGSVSTTTHTEQTTTYRAGSLEDLGRQVDEATAAVPEGWTLARVDVETHLGHQRTVGGQTLRTMLSYVAQVEYQRTVRT